MGLGGIEGAGVQSEYFIEDCGEQPYRNAAPLSTIFHRGNASKFSTSQKRKSG
jgi:hypothetical protein